MNDFDYFNLLHWTPEAKAKLQNVPFFARLQARQKIERLAIAARLEEVTVELVDQAREEFGQ